MSRPVARVPKHLIWDFDGTLYDTYAEISGALLYALNDFRRVAAPSEVYALAKVSVFHAVTTLANRFLLPADDLMARYRRYHLAQTDLHPYYGAADCLAKTARMGCRHYLFTHREKESALGALKRDDLDLYFTDYVTRDMGFADKPSPEAVLHLMEKNGFAARDAYMIGDRDIDLLSGSAAGVDGILFDPGHFYDGFDAPHRVVSMEELTALMDQCTRAAHGQERA
ncbi:MAG: HAD hydrolase-like protein [Eubacteriales bacterium]|nr:HAD hydrolase-like protein [Eubacteriales bacterium]